MRLRWLLLSVLAVAAAASAGDSVRSDAGKVRVLRAGDTILRVQVLGPVERARSAELHRWLAETADATLTAFGRYPLRDATVRIEQQASRSRSPVPWGQTSRRNGVAVLLYVREDATLEELRADWTAVHELSHLFHPYLGDDGRWLAEGLASYYQNVLRARAGLLDDREAWRRLDAGFGRGRRETSGLPLQELGRRHRGTMRVYWAGAAYWLEADLALRREYGSSLDAVLARYSRCCLSGSGEVGPAAFVKRLDELAGATLFDALFARYAESTAFPDLDGAYAALGLEGNDGTLRFSARRDAAHLRAAIMGRRETPPPP